MFYAFLWTCQVTDYFQILSVGNCLPFTCWGRWRGVGWRERRQLGRFMNQRWGAQARTHQQDVLARWFLTSLSYFLKPLFFRIIKLALRTNEIKRYRAINQSNLIIYTFDLRWTLLKYLRTFFHGNVVLMIGLTDQSDHSIFHFMVRFFICTVHKKARHFAKRNTICVTFLFTKI